MRIEELGQYECTGCSDLLSYGGAADGSTNAIHGVMAKQHGHRTGAD